MDTSKLAVHPAEFWATVETIEKLNKRKLCLAAATGSCGGHIIQAHTIPKSQLSKIAVNGQVYYIKATPADLLANDGRFTAGKRGISQFSVLNFFCATHDREIFSHIENDQLVFDPHQLALLHYRAMGAELYKKASALDGCRHHIKQIQSQPTIDYEKLEFMKAFEGGSLLGLRDMTRTFSLCEAILRDQTYDRVSGLVVQFEKMPTIMTVGGFSPEFDYNGKQVQRLGSAKQTYEQVGLSILASENRACIVFTWLKGATACRQFAESFAAQDHTQLATLGIQTSFEHIENTCMNINWWDSLKRIEREKLLERMQFAGSPVQERTSGCLRYCGITFDEWHYVAHRYI